MFKIITRFIDQLDEIPMGAFEGIATFRPLLIIWRLW